MIKTARKRRVHWLDVVVFAALLLLVAYVAYRVQSVLHYRWNWSVIPRYFIRWDAETHEWVGNLLLQGLLTTIRLSLWGSVVAAAIGLLMGLSRVGHNLFLRLVSRTYVELIRNIPPLVFIFIFYFFISSQIMPLLKLDVLVQHGSPGTLETIRLLFGDPDMLTAFVPGVLAVAMFEGAYVTEIVRAGIQSIEKGQWEASASLGLSKLQTLRKVIMPQAFQRILLPLTSQFISLIKDSAIVSLISVPELTFQGSQVTVSTTSMFEVWITVAALYFIMCFACALGFGRLQARMQSTMQRH